MIILDFIITFKMIVIRYENNLLFHRFWSVDDEQVFDPYDDFYDDEQVLVIIFPVLLFGNFFDSDPSPH